MILYFADKGIRAPLHPRGFPPETAHLDNKHFRRCLYSLLPREPPLPCTPRGHIPKDPFSTICSIPLRRQMIIRWLIYHNVL